VHDVRIRGMSGGTAEAGGVTVEDVVTYRCVMHNLDNWRASTGGFWAGGVYFTGAYKSGFTRQQPAQNVYVRRLENRESWGEGITFGDQDNTNAADIRILDSPGAAFYFGNCINCKWNRMLIESAPGAYNGRGGIFSHEAFMGSDWPLRRWSTGCEITNSVFNNKGETAWIITTEGGSIDPDQGLAGFRLAGNVFYNTNVLWNTPDENMATTGASAWRTQKLARPQNLVWGNAFLNSYVWFTNPEHWIRADNAYAGTALTGPRPNGVNNGQGTNYRQVAKDGHFINTSARSLEGFKLASGSSLRGGAALSRSAQVGWPQLDRDAFAGVRS
jgi:hypothetical protein